MKVTLDERSVEDYRLYLRIKALPRFHFVGHDAFFPDEYSGVLGLGTHREGAADYVPLRGLFDYQRDVSRLAIRKRKFAVFMAPGRGKTLIDFEFARHVLAVTGKRVLIVAPLMVVRQMVRECARFYGDSFRGEEVRAAGLVKWLHGSSPVLGITNYEAIRAGTPQGNLGGLVLSDSSMLKSHYGKWGGRLIEMGKGLEWKLCETGTPAPNDRIEFANHAVFLDQFPNVNSFLARFFVNRGQTNERWELKPHALKPFYTALSHWCIFVDDPATYGWKDEAGSLPPIITHVHDVPLTREQADLTVKAGGDMYGTPGGITSRSVLARLAKGSHKGKRVATNKTAFIRDLIAGWTPGESTLVWAKYNDEQDDVAAALPGCGNIDGRTKQGERERVVEDFQAGRVSVLVSKPDILGMGLNLQRATRQVFSTCQDSYEEWYQAVKRSNRVGSTLPLNVHVPLTPLERPMYETILRKAKRIEEDTREQERIFKECRHE